NKKKITKIVLTLITDLVVTRITILTLTTTIDPMIEGITIVTLIIVLDYEKEIDYVTTTDLIIILGIITDQEAKKEVNLEIDIEAETEVMITETDLEADLQLLISEKLMLLTSLMIMTLNSSSLTSSMSQYKQLLKPTSLNPLTTI